MPGIENYAGRLALVTGASAGMGRLYAERYAVSGADIILVARRKERLETLARHIEATHGVRAYVMPQDLGVTDAHVQVMERVQAIGRPVDILINNAGFSIAETYVETEWARQESFIGTLVTAVASMTHATLPAMVEQKWGRIINVSSMLAYAPGGVGHTLYPAAKAFVLRFSQSLHHELRGSGVHCTVTCPGSTATEFKLANGLGTGKPVKPSLFVQSTEAVVMAAMRANARNRAVHVAGWHNKIAVSAMQLFPDEWFAPFARIAADK